MKNETANMPAPIYFFQNYLADKPVSYEGFPDEYAENSASVHFTEKDISFSYTIHDDSIMASACPVTKIFCSDEDVQNKIKEYLQRYNFSSMMTWFYFSIINKNELNIYCEADYFFEPENMEYTLLEITDELKKSINDVYDYIKKLTNENTQKKER